MPTVVKRSPFLVAVSSLRKPRKKRLEAESDQLAAKRDISMQVPTELRRSQFTYRPFRTTDENYKTQ